MEELDPNQLDDRQLLLLTYQAVIDQGKRVESHGKRLSSLEAWRNILIGGGAIIAATWKIVASSLESKSG